MSAARAPVSASEERLRLLELQVERLVARCESYRSEQAHIVADADARLEALEHSLYGNSHPGLMTRVTLLEEDRAGRLRRQLPIWSACVGLLLKTLYDLLAGHR